MKGINESVGNLNSWTQCLPRVPYGRGWSRHGFGLPVREPDRRHLHDIEGELDNSKEPKEWLNSPGTNENLGKT